MYAAYYDFTDQEQCKKATLLVKGRNTQINKYAQIQLQSATEVNIYKLSSSQYILPYGSVCYITICSLTKFKDIFPDRKQVYLFIQLNQKKLISETRLNIICAIIW